MPELAFPVKGIAEPGILIEITDNSMHIETGGYFSCFSLALISRTAVLCHNSNLLTLEAMHLRSTKESLVPQPKQEADARQ